VGAGGAQAAWLLARHADHDRPSQRRCPALLQEAVQKGEADGAQLAYLTDRHSPTSASRSTALSW
jgi:hypothetical protein